MPPGTHGSCGAGQHHGVAAAIIKGKNDRTASHTQRQCDQERSEVCGSQRGCARRRPRRRRMARHGVVTKSDRDPGTGPLPWNELHDDRRFRCRDRDLGRQMPFLKQRDPAGFVHGDTSRRDACVPIPGTKKREHLEMPRNANPSIHEEEQRNNTPVECSLHGSHQWQSTNPIIE